MDEARSYVRERAREARELITVLPAGPVRQALDTFADLVATRTT
jgi:heptaprenyl diphosphate synthase